LTWDGLAPYIDYMKLQALLLCSDEKIERVLRRVLGDLEINIEHCVDADVAVRRLSRERFEAVVVDCDDSESSALVLKGARSGPRNKRAVAVAILDSQKAMRSAFDLGAHFVLYKPISAERAKASFRAARALMKSERRRNARVPVKVPVTLVFRGGERQVKTFTADLGEGGLAVEVQQRLNANGAINIAFTLPGTQHKIDCSGEIAWENGGQQVGIRFVEVPGEAREQLKRWLQSQMEDVDGDDPPVSCKLTDLSLGGCYMELAAPFPVRTKVILILGTGEAARKIEGIVRVTHPEGGMGVEFARETAKQKQSLEAFIQALMNCGGEIPDLLVQPDGLDAVEATSPSAVPVKTNDPLLDLFRNKASLAPEEFRAELEKQRSGHAEASAVNA
jgi:c-di-GMP-binding flagellar brake protein YcgR